jgi:hypothetical protein
MNEADLQRPETSVTASTPAEGAQDKRKRKREREKANKRTAETSKVPKLEGDNDRNSKKPAKLLEPKKPSKPENVNDSIASMDPNLIADYISRQLRRFEKELSAVELEDRSVSAGAFLDTTSFVKERTLANLPEFLETCNTIAILRVVYSVANLLCYSFKWETTKRNLGNARITAYNHYHCRRTTGNRSCPCC